MAIPTLTASTTLILPSTGNIFYITGTTPIERISSRPEGDRLVIIPQTHAGRFISSMTELMMDDTVDYWWDVADIFEFVSEGVVGGVQKWSELCRNEASYIVDGRYRIKTDVFQTLSSSWVDVPGLSIDYRIRSANSGVLLKSVLSCSTDFCILHARLVRVHPNGTVTPLGVGDAAGSRTRAIAGAFTQFGGTELESISMNVLDKPEDNETIYTYKVQVRSNDGTKNIQINRSLTNTDDSYHARTSSWFELQELRGTYGS